MTTWIVGPIAWDTVVYADKFLQRGGSVQGKKFIGRPGGTGANVAKALSTASVETGFVGYLGDDLYAQELETSISSSEISKLHLKRIEGASSHVLILIDGSGERSILGLAPDRMDCVNLKDVPLAPGDTVVFVLWREHFLKDLQMAKAAGCRIVVGLEAVNDPRVSGIDLAIGSHHDVSADFEPLANLERFDTIVVTSGAAGATEYSKNGVAQTPAVAARVIDATGAGDAFLAGYLTGLDRGLPTASARLQLAARWASETISTEGSVPPKFNESWITH